MERFSKVYVPHGVPVGECLMPDVFESRPSHGIFHRELLTGRRDPVLVAAAQEDRNAEEIAGRLKMPAGFGYPLLISSP